MDTQTQRSTDTITLRLPRLEDGSRIYTLVKQSPPLDVNSEYLYFLQSSHFANTCVLAEQADTLAGFVSGYLINNQPEELFIWQVAVASEFRGQQLALRMIEELLKRPECKKVRSISTTISPSNRASQRLFEKLADRFGLTIAQQPFIEAQQFSQSGHEAEVLYRLSTQPESYINKHQGA
ncbi:diaminobutyrate acetyltransferase [Sulfurirhabdus autotrophica]|uniref:L-2,4-diaminobutyric acid acetyltransferase n=1 Tax=Sulfurirhabdus autotrophica TaxID=1706046 RepID=A0A4R3Y4X3_9PROT|nr:diaminobutyrate acetyltransferase [Sulfurirhabdus autotrophica]TCV85173.1 L-2,4-diaminobutyric acid acetyltransferase [Sulfurirhabdus autotrophica]